MRLCHRGVLEELRAMVADHTRSLDAEDPRRDTLDRATQVCRARHSRCASAARRSWLFAGRGGNRSLRPHPGRMVAGQAGRGGRGARYDPLTAFRGPRCPRMPRCGQRRARLQARGVTRGPRLPRPERPGPVRDPRAPSDGAVTSGRSAIGPLGPPACAARSDRAQSIEMSPLMPSVSAPLQAGVRGIAPPPHWVVEGKVLP